MALARYLANQGFNICIISNKNIDLKSLNDEMELKKGKYKKYLQFRDFQKNDGTFSPPVFKSKVIINNFEYQKLEELF